MSFTCGLDFGTHQTKVCVEDALNPAQKIYEFIEFKSLDGKTVLLPSIVQINTDETVSYGFYDRTKCKMIFDEGTEKPKLDLLPEPQLELPHKPEKPTYPEEPEKECENKSLLVRWIENITNREKKKYTAELNRWKEVCQQIEDDYNKEYAVYKKMADEKIAEYSSQIMHWRNENHKRKEKYSIELEKIAKEKLRYRYFKQATFTNNSTWTHSIRPEIITAWYLANILLTLQEKYGEEFFVQMGIPSGMTKSVLNSQKNKAYCILIAAYKLVYKYKTKESFLGESYKSLLKNTSISKTYSHQELSDYGLFVMPEAYAGLSSITQQKRVQNGMSLLVDIGGGTTDIAFFTINEDGDQPDIHAVVSFPKGLNYIFEHFIKKEKNRTLSEAQKLFMEKEGDESIFQEGISKYHGQLKNEVKKLVEEVQRSFEFRKQFHRLQISNFTDAIKNRPVIFCGGGSIYKSMQSTIESFTDIKRINKNLLNIPFVKNKNIKRNLYTILATSYGLSVPIEDDIKLTPIDEIFSHIEKSSTQDDDYGYEHGLTDY